jgi:hypothetical protein
VIDMKRRKKSLPLGVDLGTESVSVVAADASSDGFTIAESRTLAVNKPSDGNVDRAIAETIRTLLASLTTKERRCILAAPAADTVMKTFRVPPHMRRREAERAAALEANVIVDWPSAERLVALDPIPGRSDEMLLTIARNRSIERIVAIARAAGLRAVAVDTAACAWRRALPHTDAILDCSNDQANLDIFGDPIGVTHRFPPRLIDERLASSVRAALVEARREGIADPQRLAVLGSRLRFELLDELLNNDGYALSLVSFGDVEAPSWSLAYGLATWSIARRGMASA